MSLVPAFPPQGNLGLRFQHPAPVQPGVLGNIGWREEENLARQGQDAAAAAAPVAATVAPAKAAAADGNLGMYTMEEVEQHASEESAWFVHEGKVGCDRPVTGCGQGGGLRAWRTCTPNVRPACGVQLLLVLVAARADSRDSQLAHMPVAASSHVQLAVRSGCAQAVSDCVHHVLPCLVLLFSQVYDATPFLNDHPGGAESILISCGELQTMALLSWLTTAQIMLCDSNILSSVCSPKPRCCTCQWLGAWCS